MTNAEMAGLSWTGTYAALVCVGFIEEWHVSICVGFGEKEYGATGGRFVADAEGERQGGVALGVAVGGMRSAAKCWNARN